MHMDKKLFTEAYLAMFRQYFPDFVFTEEGEFEISINVPGGKRFTAFLDNTYMECQADPESMEEVMVRYVTSLGKLINQQDSEEEEVLLPENIMPVVRSSADMEYFRESGMGDKLVFKPYNDELYVFFVEDTETTVRYLVEDDLEVLGMSVEQVYRLAIENLSGNLPEIKCNGDNGLYSIVVGGTYESSLILWKELLSEKNFPVEGEMVVSVPARDLILVTGSRDRENIGELVKIVEECYEEWSYPVSPLLFKWDGECFVKYSPEDVS